jgi:hypothetical protein
MTVEQDIVLIHFEEKPLAFARIESIAPDIKRNWYQVKMLLLQVPLQAVTWILREAYINGEPFTMNGKAMRLERVICPDEPEEDNDLNHDNQPNGISPKGNIISLADLKKK